MCESRKINDTILGYIIFEDSSYKMFSENKKKNVDHDTRFLATKQNEPLYEKVDKNKS